MVPIGLPARRLAGVAGAEIDLRARWANLDVIPSARLEAMQDASAGATPAGSRSTGRRRCPVGLPVPALGLVRPLVERPALKSPSKANVGRYAACPRSSSSMATAPRWSWATPVSCPSAAPTRSGLCRSIARAPASGCSSRTIAVRRAGRRSHPVAVRVVGAGARRQHGAGAHSRRRAGAAPGAGRHARVVGQGTFLDARDRSAAPAASGNQLPFHPRYRGYVRPELVRMDLPAAAGAGRLRGRRAAYALLHRRGEPVRLGDSPAARLRRHGRLAARTLRLTAAPPTSPTRARKTWTTGRCPAVRCSWRSRMRRSATPGGGSRSSIPSFGQ